MAIIRNDGVKRSSRIPDDVVEQVKQRADENLVEIVAAAVHLRKAGQSFVGLCPFHSESTPSFNVVPAKGFFFCHGCGEKGRAVDFQQKYFGMSFPDVIREFAGRFGVRLPGENGPLSAGPPKQPIARRQPTPADDLPPPVSFERRQELSAVLEEALAAYRSPALGNHPLTDALKEWVIGRRLTDESIDLFEIGISPQGWHGLRETFGNRYDDPLLLDADLVRETEDQKRRFDTFRDRIIFPVRDADGALVGFGGRRLQDNKKGEQTPKYLNTGTTDIFHKGHLLYGLHLAKQEIAARGYALVVEGYMDVVMLAQYGFRNTVAAMGTAFRGSHLNQLCRHTSEVVYLFDGDAAGERAMWRAVKESLPYADRVNFRFITLDGQDPDEWVRSVGAPAVQKAVTHGESLASYFLRRVRETVLQDAADSAEPGDGRQRNVGQQDRSHELKGMLALIPERSSLRQYLEREVKRLLIPSETSSQKCQTAHQLDGLPPVKRLAIAAMLQPDLAGRMRPALLALLPPEHPESSKVITLFDRGLQEGRSKNQPQRTQSDREWARVTLTHTPELLTELLAPTESPYQVDQTRPRDRSAPSQ